MLNILSEIFCFIEKDSLIGLINEHFRIDRQRPINPLDYINLQCEEKL